MCRSRSRSVEEEEEEEEEKEEEEEEEEEEEGEEEEEEEEKEEQRGDANDGWRLGQLPQRVGLQPRQMRSSTLYVSHIDLAVPVQEDVCTKAETVLVFVWLSQLVYSPSIAVADLESCLTCLTASFVISNHLLFERL
ncbi:unnamed protein product [Pleuronectes platessa]|uniref:Uncharacterized protein n=1 Tax=Pleuronectes platessa TaxID=8262 RepID=A0A9N7UST2_PLEPL|nr:unnamed protein product [Pleuronectes platessa]